MEIDKMEWLDAIHAHYGRKMVTPVHAAAEILLALLEVRLDHNAMARSINRRGRKAGDDVMATTTAADCADAVEELITFGFLETVFVASSPHQDAPFGLEEHVLELRLPQLRVTYREEDA